MFELKTHCCGELIILNSSLEQALKVAKRDGISLAYADLTDYWLLRTNLSGMDLRGVDFSSSVFDDSNFEGADFTGAIVSNASFHDCDMRNVNRTNVVFETGALDGALIEGIYFDAVNPNPVVPVVEEWSDRMREIRQETYETLPTPPNASSINRTRNSFITQVSYQSYPNMFGGITE